MHIRPTFVAVGTLLSLAMISCEKTVTPTPPEATPETQQSQVEDPAPAPPVASAATPSPAAPVAAATPAPAQLAPEGVYFLTRKVSFETPEGIVGLSPGTQAVKQADGRYLADGHMVDLQPDQITNDLALARQAAAADQSAQQKIRQALKPRQAPKNPAATAAGRGSPTPEPERRTAYQAPEKQPVESASGLSGGVKSNSGLNAAHTRTGEGLLWQKSADGKWWVAVKRLDGKYMGYIPDKPAR